MREFLANYRKIANDTSGLVTLGALQMLLIAVVTKRSDLVNTGWWSPGFWLTMVVSVGVFVLTGISVISTICQDKNISERQKSVLVVIFIMVFFAALFSAVIGVKAL
ncbi:hypothetical protein IB231_22330 [Pantoea sp. PNT02]|uniref:hypothetical protein n=1 Tax=Pantoea sp. PNT02 TaxID=2769261 RepID=UPI001786CD73|nr:hypothetical protein [Pantoea sp. PNT02]MBD9646360.1 hypothetical protein [Pantoea sp. PNT02]